MTSKCKKSQIWPFRPWKMTFRAIQPNLSFDMWFMSPKRSLMPKKKKSYWSVSEIDPSPPQSWRTDGQTDGRTDRQTDRRTTDKSVLEKLRCLSAGGANKSDICNKVIHGSSVCVSSPYPQSDYSCPHWLYGPRVYHVCVCVCTICYGLKLVEK